MPSQAPSVRSTIYLLRHAESVHNVTKDFSIRDPGLTDLGKTQASALRTTRAFPASDSIGLILSSPLTRTIETTLAAFGETIAKNDRATKLVFEPLLQERSDLPCDTGSELSVLQERFPGLGFDAEVLKEGWWVKEAKTAADDAAVAGRAAEVRKKLLGYARELEEKEGDKVDIVVVTHGVFMKFLAEDEGIDLPKAGWKGYRVEEREGGEAVLVAV
ncbi:phosphoglycerate mutase-like protein [Cladorrhinum sp. PSN332]|nr:phosphoglycerate mutase-like protein [Cladorrhinum sp. PSN332]